MLSSLSATTIDCWEWPVQVRRRTSGTTCLSTRRTRHRAGILGLDTLWPWASVVPLLALSAPNIGRAAGKVHVTAFKVYYLTCSYYSEKKQCAPWNYVLRGAMAKKPAGAKKNQYSYPIGDWKGEQNWFSQNLFSAKYSTFATAAPKLWKAQKGVLGLQSQPQWKPSLTDIQVFFAPKWKKP